MSAVTELRPLADAPSVAVRDAWGNTLVALAEQYPELVVLDGDLANSTRADIFAAALPDRFFEMGIAEQNLLGVAAGIATCGFVPSISTFTAFLTSRAPRSDPGSGCPSRTSTSSSAAPTAAF